MFVRFRTARNRLQVSLIETRRIEGKVRHEHVAGLGTIEIPVTVAGRIGFWQALHERLGKLANRITDPTSVYTAIHARIPMVTPEEQRALQLENAEADERLWRQLSELQTELAEDNAQLATKVGHTAAEAKAQAENASSKADAAKDRVERLKRGEAVSGGLGKPVDFDQIAREAGWTAADFRSAQQAAMIFELGGAAAEEALVDEIMKRNRSAEKSAKRAVLRREIEKALAEGRAKIDGDQLLLRRRPEKA